MNIDFLSAELPQLAEGYHEENSGELCAMELVAFIEGLPHSDSPPCTCRVLASFTRNWNDACPDHLRNRIMPVLPMLVGTVNLQLERARAEYFAFAARDWAVIALRGKISDELVDKLAAASTLNEIKNTAKTVADAADAANAANAAANAANAAYAANAAAYAAYAAANAAAADTDAIWLGALDALKGAIELDLNHAPAQWSEDDYQRAFEAMA